MPRLTYVVWNTGIRSSTLSGSMLNQVETNPGGACGPTFGIQKLKIKMSKDLYDPTILPFIFSGFAAMHLFVVCHLTPTVRTTGFPNLFLFDVFATSLVRRWMMQSTHHRRWESQNSLKLRWTSHWVTGKENSSLEIIQRSLERTDLSLKWNNLNRKFWCGDFYLWSGQIMFEQL